jgi:hypothetical protein
MLNLACAAPKTAPNLPWSAPPHANPDVAGAPRALAATTSETTRPGEPPAWARLPAILPLAPSLRNDLDARYLDASLAFVMVWPRQPTDGCFPQALKAVDMRGDHVTLEYLRSDPNWKLWDEGGLACLLVGQKWGYVNAKGKIVIQPQFDLAYNFSEDRAVVLVGDKQGYIDKTGRCVIEPRFELAYWFSGGRAAVKVAGKFGIIDRDGRWIVQPTYWYMTPYGRGFEVLFEDEREVFLDGDGRPTSKESLTR